MRDRLLELFPAMELQALSFTAYDLSFCSIIWKHPDGLDSSRPPARRQKRRVLKNGRDTI